MIESTLLGDWTEQYAGSKLDLTGYHLNFEDNFNAMSVGTANADPSTAQWFSPVGANFGSATFVGPTAAVNPYSVGAGALTISMQQVNGAWQSGEIQTTNQGGQGFTQQYGYFEMSAKFPAGAGSWPAFWLLSADNSKPRVEIDVVEAYGGNDLDGHHTAVHFTPVGGSTLTQKVENSEYTNVAGSMFDGQFHTYGALVTPDWIVIYYDHAELARFPSNDYVGTPLYMVADLAMYGPEAGQASGKYDMTIDYIRAYADPRYTGLVLNGSSAGDNLQGNQYVDTLNGGTGADTMTGGGGNDVYYVDNSGDKVVEAAGGGSDQVYSSVSFSAAGQDIEKVALTGSANLNVTGNALANELKGNAGANVVDGGAGADTLNGGAGNDTYYVDNAGDKVIEAPGGGTDIVYSSASFSASGQEIENITLTGSGAANATGNDLKNVLTGNAGDNVLDGKAGDDTMTGGAGNDTYYVSDGADKVVEAAAGGTDTIVSTWTLSLGNIANIENLTLAGSANLNGYGNGVDNVLTGNSGANILDGGAGNDTINGGAGGDTLTGGAGADLFVFNSPLGTVDVIKDFSPVDDAIQLDPAVFTALPAGALAAAAFVVGSAASDSGDRVIYDMTNGALYYDPDGTGSAAQVKFAQLNGGLSVTGADFTVGGGASGTSAATPQAAPATTASSGADTLQGTAGADTLAGGAGDDSYTVNSTGDRVIEAVANGTDTVMSSVSFSASGQEIENITLTGSANINATGNDLKNVLTGNAGDNVLNGGASDDTMSGGAGNDTYYVSDGADKVIEAAGAGTDTIISTWTLSLGNIANVENLTLAGSANLNGYGSGTDNALKGNTGANILDGSAGNDTVDGGVGADTLTGGAGADVFAFGTPLGSGNVDVVKDFNPVDDVFHLNSGIFTALTDGALPAGAFAVGSAAVAADDRIIYDQTNGALYYDADGAGGATQVKFAQLLGGLSLTSADFVVV